jgi:hypothetical protein
MVRADAMQEHSKSLESITATALCVYEVIDPCRSGKRVRKKGFRHFISIDERVLDIVEMRAGSVVARSTWRYRPVNLRQEVEYGTPQHPLVHWPSVSKRVIRSIKIMSSSIHYHIIVIF